MKTVSAIAVGLDFGIRHDSRSVAIALIGLLACVIIYLVYKFAWHRDFGMPIRRRLLCRSMRVEHDRMAFVPFYWSDVQVQHAIKGHWKQSVRRRSPGR